jgi:hypothetical protein
MDREETFYTPSNAGGHGDCLEYPTDPGRVIVLSAFEPAVTEGDNGKVD